MLERHQVYIGLGSNLGNKLDFLQKAIDAIFLKIGAIGSISSVYKSAALGFEGPTFLNACCELKTTLSANELLIELKNIESNLGRAENNTSGYVSRVIDLDILFYEDQVLVEDNLVLPHPRLHERQFVLEPLNSIASQKVHPKFNITIEELHRNCLDASNLQKTELRLKDPKQNFTFSQLNYLSIEGNIGSGKTTLAKMIAEEFNGRLILERFADNPFLPKFYQDPERYAFTLEMSFLADRYQQITDDLAQLNLFKDFVVSDYYVYKSLIFSKITLSEEEFRLYRTLFYQMYKDLPYPDLYVYMYQSTSRLKANIEKRGRSYEQNISETYLEKIQKGYLEFLKKQPHLNVKIIDISERDFVENRSDFIWLLNAIEQG